MSSSLLHQGVYVLLFCVIITAAFTLSSMLLIVIQKRFVALLTQTEKPVPIEIEQEATQEFAETTEHRKEVQLSAEKTAAIKAALLKRRQAPQQDA